MNTIVRCEALQRILECIQTILMNWLVTEHKSKTLFIMIADTNITLKSRFWRQDIKTTHHW